MVRPGATEPCGRRRASATAFTAPSAAAIDLPHAGAVRPGAAGPLAVLARPAVGNVVLSPFESTPAPIQVSYGLERLDHAVGNVPDLIPQVEYMAKAFGELVLCAVGTGCWGRERLPGELAATPQCCACGTGCKEAPVRSGLGCCLVSQCTPRPGGSTKAARPCNQLTALRCSPSAVGAPLLLLGVTSAVGCY